jgi:hypothetical protein
MTESLFEGVPGPSPWYLPIGGEVLPGFRWHSPGDRARSSGKTLLVGSEGPVAVLGFYNYVVRLNDATLLLWRQPEVNAGPTAPVVLTLLKPHTLSVLTGDLDALFERMDERGEPLLVAGQPSSRCLIPTSGPGPNATIRFPSEMRQLTELLILCRSSIANETPSWQRFDLALLVAHPSRSSVHIYPQDWFNDGTHDYGYQWVTRVARNVKTGHVHGEGIRISPFVLDDSLRRLRT